MTQGEQGIPGSNGEPGLPGLTTYITKNHEGQYIRPVSIQNTITTYARFH